MKTEEAIRSWGIADSRECAEGVELPTGGEQNYVSVDIDLEWSLGCVEAFRLVLDLGTPEVDVRRFWNRHARSVGNHTVTSYSVSLSWASCNWYCL